MRKYPDLKENQGARVRIESQIIDELNKSHLAQHDSFSEDDDDDFGDLAG